MSEPTAVYFVEKSDAEMISDAIESLGSFATEVHELNHKIETTNAILERIALCLSLMAER